jgi:hypothetical protein
MEPSDLPIVQRAVPWPAALQGAILELGYLRPQRSALPLSYPYKQPLYSSAHAHWSFVLYSPTAVAFCGPYID